MAFSTLFLFHRWFIDNEIVPGNHGTTLTLNSVTRQSNTKIVKCEVWNDIGKSEETETLDIHCKMTLVSKNGHNFIFLYSLTDDPRFIIEPSDISGEKGENAKLFCLVDGNPAPTYTWFKNGDMRHVSSTSIVSGKS